MLTNAYHRPESMSVSSIESVLNKPFMTLAKLCLSDQEYNELARLLPAGDSILDVCSMYLTEKAKNPISEEDMIYQMLLDRYGDEGQLVKGREYMISPQLANRVLIFLAPKAAQIARDKLNESAFDVLHWPTWTEPNVIMDVLYMYASDADYIDRQLRDIGLMPRKTGY